MSLALLPLGLISVYQTKVVVDEAQALARASLMSNTLKASSREREVIQQARGAAQSLAAIVPTLDTDECSAALRSVTGQSDLFIFAGYIQSDGMMECLSVGEPTDLSGQPSFEQAVERQSATIDFNPSGAITGAPVVIVSEPAFVDGELQGFVSLSIPLQTANDLLHEPGADGGLKMAVINIDGDIVAATRGLDAAPDFLPRNTPVESLLSRVGESFAAVAGNDENRVFAVAPLIDDNVALVGSWPSDAAVYGNSGIRALIAVVFPVLMWVVGLAVAVLGLQRLVLRHIKKLRSAMRQFALGDRSAGELAFEDPPEEFEEAQRAFNRMAFLISESDARQEQDLRDKEVLLKEVHHRVKNNLQLIASIMNMQMRNAKSVETKYMLSSLQRRVRGLAMLHRSLYTSAELTTVDSQELIQAVIDDVKMLSVDKSIPVESDLESMPLYPDQAVPLSMFVAEALTNAFKYASAGTESSPIQISLRREGEMDVHLRISNQIVEARLDEETEDIGDGLGGRLMVAFASQLDGETHHNETAESYDLHLKFKLQDFSSTRQNDEAA
ncbi:sensor histidine kinase [Marivita hallyeonensis]|nr:sensor histidine kinase [Marivita hallyeonensis]